METFGPQLGMPHTRALGKGVYKLRLKGREGIARVLNRVRRSTRHRSQRFSDTHARLGAVSMSDSCETGLRRNAGRSQSLKLGDLRGAEAACAMGGRRNFFRMRRTAPHRVFEGREALDHTAANVRISRMIWSKYCVALLINPIRLRKPWIIP